MALSSEMTAYLNILVATLLLVVLVWLLCRIRNWPLRWLERVAALPRKLFPGLTMDLRPHILQAARAVVRLAATAAIILLSFLWVVYCLGQFSSTEPWGKKLEEFLSGVMLEFATGALAAVPGLIVVIIVVCIARWCMGLINVIFTEVAEGRLVLPGLERETAQTSQTLLVVVVWVFALVVAYPYIPGSNTDAFKGLSVLIGLVVTLGSTGLINQVISGLFVVYSRSIRPEDYVRIGDVEGEVISVGSLATKLKTPQQEEITIPHSVLVGTAITNYSRLAVNHGMVIATSVTIGYDTPWRQVHGLLLLGASKTRSISTEPPPRVLQRELSDFYIQYQLSAHLEPGASRAAALSELHCQIQDVFNEHGVQIMSPHFETQPDKPVLVPKSAWYAPPALPPMTSGTSELPDEAGKSVAPKGEGEGT